jgi:hypothetical protein
MLAAAHHPSLFAALQKHIRREHNPVGDRGTIASRSRLLFQRSQAPQAHGTGKTPMIRKLASGGYRLYSRKLNPKTGRRRNLGTFKTRAAAEKHERAVQYFKRH